MKPTAVGHLAVLSGNIADDVHARHRPLRRVAGLARRALRRAEVRRGLRAAGRTRTHQSNEDGTELDLHEGISIENDVSSCRWKRAREARLKSSTATSF